MNSIAIILSLAAVASASVVPYAFPGSVAVRAPAHDSAIIQSHRLGGNFAYRTDEAHAYAVQTPVLGQRTIPVGVSYHQGTPIVKTTTDYVSHFVPQTGIATYQAPAQVIAQPIVQQQAVVAAAPSVYAHGAYAGAYNGAYAGAYPNVYAHGLGGAYTHGLGNVYAQGLGGVYAHGLNAAGIYAHGLPVAAVAAAEPVVAEE